MRLDILAQPFRTSASISATCAVATCLFGIGGTFYSWLHAADSRKSAVASERAAEQAEQSFQMAKMQLEIARGQLGEMHDLVAASRLGADASAAQARSSERGAAAADRSARSASQTAAGTARIADIAANQLSLSRDLDLETNRPRMLHTDTTFTDLQPGRPIRDMVSFRNYGRYEPHDVQFLSTIYYLKTGRAVEQNAPDCYSDDKRWQKVGQLPTGGIQSWSNDALPLDTYRGWMAGATQIVLVGALCYRDAKQVVHRTPVCSQAYPGGGGGSCQAMQDPT